MVVNEFRASNQVAEARCTVYANMDKKRIPLSRGVRCQNLKRVNQNVKVGNRSFERVREFHYLETTRTYQNCIHLGVENSFKSGKPDNHSVQNLGV